MQQARARAASPPRPDPWQRIDASWNWDDLVLPAGAVAQLQSVPALLSERYWTGAEGAQRGVVLLFAGSAGTGKTMAAQALASAMGLPILRADLEAVFARGRGEASRLLARLFASAARLGAVLELDRGDFVLSSAVAAGRPLSTRIATADLRDLLDRCESHPGVVVFPTTRTREIDDTVRARFDAAIEFPFPAQAARAEIWRRALPTGSEVSQPDVAELAEAFQLPGAAIAACCAQAGRLAAAEGAAVGLGHVARALQDEYATRLVSDATRGSLGALRARAQGVDAPVPGPEPVEMDAVAAPEMGPPGLVAPAPPPPEPEPEPLEPAHPEPPPAPEPEPPQPEPPQPEPVEPEPVEPAPVQPEPSPPPAAEFLGAPVDEAAADELVRAMAASSALAPAPARRARWGRRLARVLPLVLLGIVSAVALGLAAKRQHTSSAPATTSQPPPDRALSTRELQLRYPSNWERRSAPALRDLTLHHAVAVASSSAPTGRLVIGFGAPQTGNPLPARFIAATLTGTPPEQIVRLGNHSFYRVLDPRLSLSAPSQSVYALATGAGPVIAVCQTSSQAFTAGCERVLATLRVTATAKPSAPGPSRTYASALSRILSHLDHARATAAHDLAIARTATTQAKAAGVLAGLHAQASAEVSALHAGQATSANGALAKALRGLADAYGTLGRAALHGDAHGYRVGQARVAHAASAVAAALSTLSRLGYRIS